MSLVVDMNNTNFIQSKKFFFWFLWNNSTSIVRIKTHSCTISFGFFYYLRFDSWWCFDFFFEMLTKKETKKVAGYVIFSKKILSFNDGKIRFSKNIFLFTFYTDEKFSIYFLIYDIVKCDLSVILCQLSCYFTTHFIVSFDK